MPKNNECKVRYEKNDKEKLQKKADSLGLKISQYIRMVSLQSLNTKFELRKSKKR